MRTLENIAKTIVLTGLIMGYSYGVEFFMAWYSGDEFEMYTFLWRTDRLLCPAILDHALLQLGRSAVLSSSRRFEPT